MILGLVITQTLSWGLIASFLFITLNYFVVDSNTRKTESFEILKYGSMSGPKRNRSKRQPLITIYYHDTEKELVFSNKFYTTFEQYSHVELTTVTGLFNFDVIENKKLSGEIQEVNDLSSGAPVIFINCVINDVATDDKLEGSFLVLTNDIIKDTLFLEGDTLRFELDFNGKYLLEFGRAGYNSKSMDFSTMDIPTHLKEVSFVLPMKVSLAETEEEYKNEIVADWHFDTEKDTFIWYRD